MKIIFNLSWGGASPRLAFRVATKTRFAALALFLAPCVATA